jgi:hypothetical protein
LELTHREKGRTRAAFWRYFVLAIMVLLPLAVFATETDLIRGVSFTSPELVNGVPPGWILDRKAGTVNIRLEKEGEGFFLRLASDHNSAFGIKRELKVDLRQHPFLNWRWKAVRLPQGGDVRDSGLDDQAMQIYVAFPPTGFPERLNTPVLGYIWDNEAPRGWTGRSDQFGGGKMRYVVVRNKADRLGEWYTEKRNLYRDVQALFGDPNWAYSVTRGIELYINSQNTRTAAEGCVSDLYFSRN